jgi:hypothetical protein
LVLTLSSTLRSSGKLAQSISKLPWLPASKSGSYVSGNCSRTLTISAGVTASVIKENTERMWCTASGLHGSNKIIVLHNLLSPDLFD